MNRNRLRELFDPLVAFVLLGSLICFLISFLQCSPSSEQTTAKTVQKIDKYAPTAEQVFTEVIREMDRLYTDGGKDGD